MIMTDNEEPEEFHCISFEKLEAAPHLVGPFRISGAFSGERERVKGVKRDSRKGNADEITGKGSKMSIAVQVQLTLIRHHNLHDFRKNDRKAARG